MQPSDPLAKSGGAEARAIAGEGYLPPARAARSAVLAGRASARKMGRPPRSAPQARTLAGAGGGAPTQAANAAHQKGACQEPPAAAVIGDRRLEVPGAPAGGALETGPSAPVRLP